MKNINKKEKGITLIALVITIIILLILAGVTIGMATNGTGLFDKAKEAAEKYQNAQNEEEIQIAKYTNELNKYVSGNRDDKIVELEHRIEQLESNIQATETGSYTGTGTYGSNNKNELSFSRPPKVMFLYEVSSNVARNRIFIQGATYSGGYYADVYNAAGSLWRVNAEWSEDGKTLKWWTSHTDDGAKQQFNDNGVLYNYVVIF